MIRSMTAFARADETTEIASNADADKIRVDIGWEIRSVNHRYLDVSLYLPEGFQSHENDFKTRIGRAIKRGKVDARLRCEISENANRHEITLNKTPLNALLTVHQELQGLFGGGLTLGTMDVLQWPGVLDQSSAQATEQQKLFEAMFKPVESCLEKALEDLVQTREREGVQLSGFIMQRCDEIEKIVAMTRARRVEVMKAIREKVLKRIAELDVSVDNNRLEQELAFQAQRLDVDEELDRLEAHLAEVRDILTRDEPVGRRLDFLMQELNREANTLASKSNDTETTRAAVDLKVLIENMREQVMNIE